MIKKAFLFPDRHFNACATEMSTKLYDVMECRNVNKNWKKILVDDKSFYGSRGVCQGV